MYGRSSRTTSFKSFIFYGINVAQGLPTRRDQVAANEKFERLHGPELSRKADRYASAEVRLLTEAMEECPAEIDTLIMKYQSGEWQESMRQRGLL